MRPNRKNKPGFLARKMKALGCFIDTHNFKIIKGTKSVYRCEKCQGVYISSDGVEFISIKKIVK